MKLIKEKMPGHMAFIIDGNGRWAKKRGLPRSMGHKAGMDNLKKRIEDVRDLGIKNLSVYCFSCENWNRPQKEVDYLMNDCFTEMIKEFREKYLKEDVKLIFSGNLDDERIPEECRNGAKSLMAETAEKEGFTLNICLNYGGRQEILRAVNSLIEKGEKDIDVAKMEKELYTYGMLPCDFIIRTSRELRTSNFFPWQSTYSEWYFPKVHWPAFSKRDLMKSLIVFQKRNRRFGAIKEDNDGKKTKN